MQTRAAVIAVLTLLLSGCATTPPVALTDGAGFSKGSPTPEMQAAMINMDLKFARWYRGHVETCLKQPGCDKTR